MSKCLRMDISIRDATVDVGGSLVEFNKLRCLRGWVLDVCGGYDVEGQQDSAESFLRRRNNDDFIPILPGTAGAIRRALIVPYNVFRIAYPARACPFYINWMGPPTLVSLCSVCYDTHRLSRPDAHLLLHLEMPFMCRLLLLVVFATSSQGCQWPRPLLGCSFLVLAAHTDNDLITARSLYGILRLVCLLSGLHRCALSDRRHGEPMRLGGFSFNFEGFILSP